MQLGNLSRFIAIILVRELCGRQQLVFLYRNCVLVYFFSIRAFTTTSRAEVRKLSFGMKIRVRQGCVVSALLFNIAIAWVLQRTTENQTRGIRQTLFSAYEDLDFADDQALLSHTYHHKQEKTSRLCGLVRQICPQIG